MAQSSLFLEILIKSKPKILLIKKYQKQGFEHHQKIPR